MDIEGKTIILTGGARIGKSVAKALGSRGANLVITYLHSQKDAESMCAECKAAGSKAVPVKTDLSRSEDILMLVDKVKKAFGGMEGLVHMAAIYQKTPWAELNEGSWNKNMEIIAKSTFLLGKIVGDELLKNKGEEGIKGKIVTISDWSVLNSPYKDYLPYNAAKAAVIGLTKSFAQELAPHILVNSIAPGPILRPPDLSEADHQEVMARTLLRRWGGPEEIAKAVLYLLDADFVTGQVLYVDGGRSLG
jgi:pteridine reductase